MRRFLPAILFAICIVAPSLRADSIFTYTATEQLTKQAPAEEDYLWTFTGPQDFTLSQTLLPAGAFRLASNQTFGDWLYLAGDSLNFSPSNPPAVSIVPLTFATYGSFGEIQPRCSPNRSTDVNKWSFTFDTSLPFGYDQYVAGR